MSRQRPHLLWCSAALAWGVAATGVWAWTTSYEFTTYDVPESRPAQNWPADSNLVLADDRPTLILFLHPRCPCTRASIRELERTLMGRKLTESQQPKVIIVASLPPNASQSNRSPMSGSVSNRSPMNGSIMEWRSTDTVHRASLLPRAELAWDAGGIETSRFGAVASGAVMLYHRDGKLLFAGGVTSSRGHEGDNVGTAHLNALLSQRSRLPLESTPVFGCRLCVEQGLAARGDVCRTGLSETGSVGIVESFADERFREGAMQ